MLIGHHSKLSSTVSAFPGLNIVLMPLFIVLYICKSRTLNQLILKIEFLPILIIGILSFVVLDLLLLPITWTIIILKQCFIILLETRRCQNIKQLLLVIFLFPFTLLIDSAFNTIEFIQSVWSTKLMKIQ